MSHFTRTPYFPANLEDYAPWVTAHGLLAPYGECQCGCGQMTTRAAQSSKAEHVRKNDPYRWVSGHNGRGVRKPLALRFWAKVQKSDECWEWIGCKNSPGYGQIRVEGKALLAHRLSWEMTYGPIPEGLFVLHRCDNPACVRPDHLFLGNNRDNVQDMIAKGRNVRRSGEAVANARLSNEEARSIRLAYQAGEGSTRKLAARYGISRNTIRRIVEGKAYRET